MRLTRKSRQARKRLLELLQQGYNISQACAAVGIGRRTFYAWQQHDAEFREAVDRAYMPQIIVAERTLHQAIEAGNLRAAMWLLEHLVPEYRPPRKAEEVVDAPEVDFGALLREVSKTV